MLLRRARLVEQDSLIDLGILNGRFAAPGTCSGFTELDLEGHLVIPGFVDAHMHLDKAFALENGLAPAGSLAGAIKNFYNWRSEITPALIYRNARRAAEQALINGTLALRTHTTVDKTTGLGWLSSLLQVKSDLARHLTIQIVAFPDTTELLEGKAKDLLYKALDMGADLVGGAPLHCSNPPKAIDLLFEIAGKAGCDLDLHIDESDDPGANTLEYLAERKLALGFPGRVVAGHCTSLSAMGELEAHRIIEKVAMAGIFVITLPSCNLYLMGRNDRGLVRRGLTRARELLDAGVRVCYASDNVRDAFNPFGNADMLQQALICAHALQFGTLAELELLLRMGTEYPAEAMGLEICRMRIGDPASFVVLDGPNWGSALARIAARCYVFQGGVLSAETSVESRLLSLV
jgi:cytosine deaminase